MQHVQTKPISGTAHLVTFVILFSSFMVLFIILVQAFRKTSSIDAAWEDLARWVDKHIGD